MSLTDLDELTIRKSTTNKISTASPTAGLIIPAPLFFVDKPDYWATYQALTTQEAIETNEIAFGVFTLRQRIDFGPKACPDNPLIQLIYNLYLFRVYDFERADEDLSPDDFLKLTLKSYNDFIKSVLEIWGNFLGNQPIAGFPNEIEAVTTSITEPEFIEDKNECRYIPAVQGHSIDLQITAEVRYTNG